RVAAQAPGAADVHAVGTPPDRIVPDQPQGHGAAQRRAEVAAVVESGEPRVEAPVAHVVHEARGEIHAPAVDRTGGQPQRVVLDVAEEVGGEPPHAADV